MTLSSESGNNTRALASEPLVIIVQGGPAVGKTTLARKLAKDLGIGLLAKDDVKELLFDRIGLPSGREDSRVYGQATMAALFTILRVMVQAGKSVVIESAFHKELAEKDFAAIEAVSDLQLLQLFCYTDHQTQQQRYQHRIVRGERHPGHLDSADHLLEFEVYDELYGPLAFFNTLKVDTT